MSRGSARDARRSPMSGGQRNLLNVGKGGEEGGDGKVIVLVDGGRRVRRKGGREGRGGGQMININSRAD